MRVIHAVPLLAILGFEACQCHAKPFYDEQSSVATIDSSAAYADLFESNSIWMLHVFSPQHCDEECEETAKEFIRLANICKGIFRVGVIDAPSMIQAGVDLKQLKGFDVNQLYEAKDASAAYLYGGDGKNAKRYKGPMETQDLMQDIMEVALETLRDRAGHYEHPDWDPAAKKHRRASNAAGGNTKTSSSGGGGAKAETGSVLEMTSATFRQKVTKNPGLSIVAFTAPWCGHCKKLRPTWEEVAQKLGGDGIVVGWVDATAEKSIGEKFKINSYPTIKIFRGSEDGVDVKVMDYNGDRGTIAVINAVLEQMKQFGISRNVVEMTSAEAFETECSGANHICIMAALPHILDSGAEGRNRYKDVVGAVSTRFGAYDYSFFWFEGPSQPQVEKVFGLTFGYPTLVAYSMDRGAYAVMKGSFSEKTMSTFLHGLTSGRQATQKAPGVPQIESTEPWDGKDGEVIEEELSLAEIMGWDDDEDDAETDEL